MSRFLSYIVEHSLTGEATGLKESLIGVAVFDRSPGYDPKTDPVVRSEARRLREKILQYYASDGQNDRVLIDCPKGSYVARFEFHTEPSPAISGGVQEELRSVPFNTRRAWIGAGAALSLTVFAAVLLLTRYRERQSPFLNPENRIFRVTSSTACDLEPSLSPDGRRVAFVRGQAYGGFSIYEMAVEGGQPKRLTSGPWWDLHPAYSPDGKWIAFVRAQPSGLEFRMIPAGGGNETKLTEIRLFEWMSWRTHPLLFSSHPGPAWTPDGKSIVICDVAGDQQGGTLWSFEIATRMRRQLTRPQRIEHDFLPAVSPDGRSVAFVRQVSASSRDLYVVDLDNGVERRLTQDGTDIRGLSWTPDGKALIFSSNRNGTYRLWQCRLKDAVLDPIAATGDRIFSVSVARDGSVVVYSAATIDVSLNRYSLVGEPAKRLTDSKSFSLYPRISPDGKSIAWASDRSGSWEIWLADAGGASQRQLTRMGERSKGRLLGTPRWSPDGSMIAFDARVEGNSAIYVIPAAGGEPRLVDRNRFEERNPNFSRDGQRLYFNSNRGGIVQIWQRAFSGGPATPVSSGRAYDAVESMDGRTVYYFPPSSERGIYQIEPASGRHSVIPASARFQLGRSWDFVRGRFYFFLAGIGPKPLIRFDPLSGKAEEVAFLDTEVFDVNNLAVSPDEKWFVVARPDKLSSDLFGIAVAPR